VFNVGPFEMLVLVAVALIVFGPDKLPQLAKDAGRMLRTLRDLAQGARSQLNDELGPEFADFDLRSLNPRTAIRNALLGDEDLASLNPRDAISRALRGEDDPPAANAGQTNAGQTNAGQGNAGQGNAGQGNAGQTGAQPAAPATASSGESFDSFRPEPYDSFKAPPYDSDAT
jgi:sec-independent protein translocase protein TatB